MKPKQAQKSVKRLVDLEFVRYDYENERMWIVEHWRHELNSDDLKPRDLRRSAAEALLRAHLVSPLVAEFANRYPGTAERVMAEAPYQAPSEPLRSQEQEQEQEQDLNPSEDLGVYPETAGAPSAGSNAEPARVMDFPCDGSPASWILLKTKLDEWAESYPALRVEDECRAALQWLRDNPERRKTARGMTRFLGSWLRRAQDNPRQRRNGGRPAAARRPLPMQFTSDGEPIAPGDPRYVESPR